MSSWGLGTIAWVAVTVAVAVLIWGPSPLVIAIAVVASVVASVLVGNWPFGRWRS